MEKAIPTIVVLIKVLVVIGAALTLVAYLTLIERKVLGWIQVRVGPNRVGPWGLLQPLADGVKLLVKEEITVTDANSGSILLAPWIVVYLCLIPFSGSSRSPRASGWSALFGPDAAKSLNAGVVADINVGILLILGISSLGTYGVILGGWASNNKYSLMGGVRAGAQMISYELGLSVAVLGVLLLAELEPGGYRNCPEIGILLRAMVRVPSAARVHSVPHSGQRGNRQDALRPDRMRERACGRVPDRVQLDEIRTILPG